MIGGFRNFQPAESIYNSTLPGRRLVRKKMQSISSLPSAKPGIEHTTKNMEVNSRHSHHLNLQFKMEFESQISTPLPSPGWRDCDIGLATYSQLFQSPPPLDLNDLFDSTFVDWDLCGPATPTHELCEDPILPCSFAEESFNSTDDLAPASSNSDTFGSEISSPKMLALCDIEETQKVEYYASEDEIDAPAPTLQGLEIIKQALVNPKRTSSHRRIPYTEPLQITRSKRIKTSAKHDDSVLSQDSTPHPSKSQSIKSRNLGKGRHPPDSLKTASPKGRKDHNSIEKKYRSKLNGQFETLLASLPPELVAEVNEARVAAKQPEKAISKAEVLALAKEHIEKLELEREALERQRKTLSGEIVDLEAIWMSLGGNLKA